MSKENPQILVLSSVDPHRGPAVVAEDQYNRLKKAGYDVDFMTLYAVEGHPEYIYVYKNIKIRLISLTYYLYKLGFNRYTKGGNGTFFYREEMVFY